MEDLDSEPFDQLLFILLSCFWNDIQVQMYGSTTLIRRSLDVHHRHTFLLDITIRFVFNQVTNIMFVTLQFNSFDKSDSSHIFSNNADLVYKIVLYYGYLALSIRNTYIFHCK